MEPNRDSNAALIAPLSSPIIMFFVLLVSGTSIPGSAFTAFFTGLISYSGFVIFILPLHKYLKAKNKENMLALVFSGLIGGSFFVSSLYLVLGIMLGSRQHFELSATIIGAMFGGGVAIAFCLLSGTTRLLPHKARGE